MEERNTILEKDAAAAKLKRMSLEIAERLSGESVPLIILGIGKNGIVIADKIAEMLQPYIQAEMKVIHMPVNKDELKEIDLKEGITLENKNVLLVDDVCNTGRTLLYALKPLLDFYPKRIQTLVMVERMHKLYPVKLDYVGLSINTTSSDFVRVEVNNDEICAVLVSNE